MTIVKWILAVLFILSLLALIPSGLGSGLIVPVILLAIAACLVLPPLDPVFKENLTFLKSNFLRIFLAIIIALASLIFIGGSTFTMETAAVCTPENASTCNDEMTILAEGVQPLTVQATFSESSSPDEVSGMEIAIEALSGVNAEAVLFDEVVGFDGSSNEFSTTLDNLDLDVGTYQASVTPVLNEDNVTASAKNLKFVVLPSEDAVARRDGQAENFDSFKNTISELRVCVDPGGEEHCDETAATIPAATQIILADVIVSNSDASYQWLSDKPEVTYFWRYYPDGPDGEPELLFEDIVDLGEKTDVYGFQLTSEEGFPPGDYDVIALIETANSQPVRTAFSVVE